MENICDRCKLEERCPFSRKNLETCILFEEKEVPEEELEERLKGGLGV